MLIQRNGALYRCVETRETISTPWAAARHRPADEKSSRTAPKSAAKASLYLPSLPRKLEFIENFGDLFAGVVDALCAEGLVQQEGEEFGDVCPPLCQRRNMDDPQAIVEVLCQAVGLALIVGGENKADVYFAFFAVWTTK